MIWLTGLACTCWAWGSGLPFPAALAHRALDNAALEPHATLIPASMPTPTLLITDLRAWCMGLGSGHALLAPPGRADVAAPRVALLTGPAPHGADRSELDRDDELAALAAQSRRQAIALKLAVKRQELWWWRARHPRQAWDCGWLRGRFGTGELQPSTADVWCRAGAVVRPRTTPPCSTCWLLTATTAPPSAAAHAGARKCPKVSRPDSLRRSVPLVCIDAPPAMLAARQN